MEESISVRDKIEELIQAKTYRNSLIRVGNTWMLDCESDLDQNEAKVASIREVGKGL